MVVGIEDFDFVGRGALAQKLLVRIEFDALYACLWTFFPFVFGYISAFNFLIISIIQDYIGIMLYLLGVRGCASKRKGNELIEGVALEALLGIKMPIDVALVDF